MLYGPASGGRCGWELSPEGKEVDESGGRRGRYCVRSTGDPCRGISICDRWCSAGFGVIDVLFRRVDIFFASLKLEFRLHRLHIHPLMFRFLPLASPLLFPPTSSRCSHNPISTQAAMRCAVLQSS